MIRGRIHRGGGGGGGDIIDILGILTTPSD